MYRYCQKCDSNYEDAYSIDDCPHRQKTVAEYNHISLKEPCHHCEGKVTATYEGADYTAPQTGWLCEKCEAVDWNVRGVPLHIAALPLGPDIDIHLVLGMKECWTDAVLRTAGYRMVVAIRIKDNKVFANYPITTIYDLKRIVVYVKDGRISLVKGKG